MTQLTSQLLIFPHTTYTIETIATALNVLPDSIWAVTDEKSIKIDTIRRLQQELSTSSAGNQTRHVVLYPAEIITNQAQQALLKLIEEPPENTQIILVTSSPNKLLATIKSRCELILLDSDNYGASQDVDEEIKELFFQIIGSTVGERVEIAARYKDRAEAIVLCNKMVSFLHQELKNKNTMLETRQITKNITHLLKTIKYFEANVNTLLAVENCFFELN